jgi:hypothetical protein
VGQYYGRFKHRRSLIRPSPPDASTPEPVRGSSPGLCCSWVLTSDLGGVLPRWPATRGLPAHSFDPLFTIYSSFIRFRDCGPAGPSLFAKIGEIAPGSAQRSTEGNPTVKASSGAIFELERGDSELEYFSSLASCRCGGKGEAEIICSPARLSYQNRS